MDVRLVGLVAALSLCAGLAGCDDIIFGEPRDGGGDGGTDTDCQNVYTSDWDGVVSLFNTECVVCHPGVEPDLEPTISADVADGTGAWVVANDAANSYLWEVLLGTGAGDPIGPMPPGAGLDVCERRHVQEWIDAGAIIP